jgi:hypothetical protein
MANKLDTQDNDYFGKMLSSDLTGLTDVFCLQKTKI